MYSLIPDALYCFKFQFRIFFMLLVEKNDILKQSVLFGWKKPYYRIPLDFFYAPSVYKMGKKKYQKAIVWWKFIEFVLFLMRSQVNAFSFYLADPLKFFIEKGFFFHIFLSVFHSVRVIRQRQFIFGGNEEEKTNLKLTKFSLFE